MSEAPDPKQSLCFLSLIFPFRDSKASTLPCISACTGYPKYWADVMGKVERQTDRWFSFNCCFALTTRLHKDEWLWWAIWKHKCSVTICVGRPLIKASIFSRENKCSCLPATGNTVLFTLCFLWLDFTKGLTVALCTAEKMREAKEAERAYKRLVTDREKAQHLHPVMEPLACFPATGHFDVRNRDYLTRGTFQSMSFSVSRKVVYGSFKEEYAYGEK